MQTVPIENIYYLLCYAWNRLDEQDLVHVSSVDCVHLTDLFARVLAFGTSHLLRRGLDRGYVMASEDLRMIRGRLDISTTAKRLLLIHGRAHCHYDELDHNVLHNRILKTTISKLVCHEQLAKENRESLAELYRRLHEIDEIELNPAVFSRVQLNRNNAFYGFLLSVCRLIYSNVLAKEGEGDYLFQDFIRDPRQMGLLFQEFVYNFLKINLEYKKAGCYVRGGEVINWDVLADEASREMLPRMITDILVDWPDRCLIIDTKFYAQTMQIYRETEKVYSAHLYQLCNYLRHIEARGPRYRHCEGMLLYPTVTDEYDFGFEDHGHPIRVKTVNLSQPWKMIHKDLLAIAESPMQSVME